MSIANPGKRQSICRRRLNAEVLEDRRLLASVDGSTEIGADSDTGRGRDLWKFSYAEIRDHVRSMVGELQTRRTSLGIPTSAERSVGPDSEITSGIDEIAIAIVEETLLPSPVQKNQPHRSAQESSPRQALAGALEGPKEVVVVAEGSAETPKRKSGWVCLTPNSQVVVSFSDQMVMIQRDEDSMVYGINESLFFESYFGNSHITFANLPADDSIHVEAIGFASTTVSQLTA